MHLCRAQHPQDLPLPRRTQPDFQGLLCRWVVWAATQASNLYTLEDKFFCTAARLECESCLY